MQPPNSYPPPQLNPQHGAALGALTHPLPAGMRDVLPASARQQAHLTRTVIETFSLFGYEPVVLPAFEYAEVLEQGLADTDGDALLRFVEPETGEVVALRPDMTPQVARLVCTRLAHAPQPMRLCYSGSVLRRRHERARNNRQVPQAGIELIGVAGQAGEFEVLETAISATRATGLKSFVVDISNPGLVDALLAELSRETQASLVEALSLKDASALSLRAAQAGLGAAALRALEALTELHGGPEIWPEADQAMRGTPAAPKLAELRALYESLSSRVPGVILSVDLGETSRFNYYTGPAFQLLAEGPGLPLGMGGRYDALYERFGSARPASGFALDLDNLAWALRAAGRDDPERARLLVSGSESVARPLVAALREIGLACALAPDEALVYARAWRYCAVVRIDDSGVTLTDVETGTDERLTESLNTAAEVIGRRFGRA